MHVWHIIFTIIIVKTACFQTVKRHARASSLTVVEYWSPKPAIEGRILHFSERLFRGVISTCAELEQYSSAIKRGGTNKNPTILRSYRPHCTALYSTLCASRAAEWLRVTRPSALNAAPRAIGGHQQRHAPRPGRKQAHVHAQRELATDFLKQRRSQWLLKGDAAKLLRHIRFLLAPDSCFFSRFFSILSLIQSRIFPTHQPSLSYCMIATNLWEWRISLASSETCDNS